MACLCHRSDKGWNDLSRLSNEETEIERERGNWIVMEREREDRRELRERTAFKHVNEWKICFEKKNRTDCHWHVVRRTDSFSNERTERFKKERKTENRFPRFPFSHLFFPSFFLSFFPSFSLSFFPRPSFLTLKMVIHFNVWKIIVQTDSLLFRKRGEVSLESRFFVVTFKFLVQFINEGRMNADRKERKKQDGNVIHLTFPFHHLSLFCHWHTFQGVKRCNLFDSVSRTGPGTPAMGNTIPAPVPALSPLVDPKMETVSRGSCVSEQKEKRWTRMFQL